MNWVVFGIGAFFGVGGYVLLAKSKKGTAAFIGTFFALVGGWFALTGIDYGSHGSALLLLSVTWFIVVSITMVRAPSDATTLVGLGFTVLGIFAFAQTDPINHWEISSHFGDALDVAKRTWQNIFNAGTK